MKTTPYLIDQSIKGSQLRPIDTTEGVYGEAWLQELLRKYPTMLPVDEIEPVFAPLIPIGREIPTDVGYIDNLFISPRGYLTLVETKLWRNPEARREVLAQAIDYGSSISKWNYQDLNAAVEHYTQRFEVGKRSLAKWVEENVGPLDGGEIFFEETVEKNLRLGRFLTLIVSDRVRQSMVDMLDYVNRYPHLAMDVALVEINCYHANRDAAWPMFIVPAVVARTAIVERSVIQVTVEAKGTYQVDVRQEKSISKAGKRRSVSLTEEAFWELLRTNAPSSVEIVKNLIDHYRQQDQISIDMSQASLVVRCYLLDSGQKTTLFFVDTNGWVSTWPITIATQLERAGLDRNLIDSYGAKIRTILHSEKRRQPSEQANKVNMKAFIDAVDVLVQEIQAASE